MRKRSMSVFIPRDDHRLSKKFEGVASDNDAHSDSENEELDTEMHLGEAKVAVNDVVLSDEWTKSDYEVLVSQLKEQLPKKDIRKWKTSLQAVNWEQIKVRNHTTAEVERVARQVISKVRPFRTLGEILDDVPDVVTKLLSAERPKPPLTAYSLFVKEILPKLREENKEMKVQQIFKLVPERYQELSTKKRRKYDEEAARMKEEYHANLTKFYQDHPDLMPKKGYKVRKEPLKTPFQLFYQSRRNTSANISFQQARKEWDQLAMMKKIKFIRKSFEAQSDTDSKLLNKKELEMLDFSFGKPEFMGRNVYEYFRRKMRAQYEEMDGKKRELELRKEYKNLDDRQHLDLKEEFQKARDAFIIQYQGYIEKLSPDKQQAEIDFLKTISDKAATKKPKSDKKTPKPKEELAEEDPPVAESTTIAKKSSTKVKKVKKEHKSEESDEESESSVHKMSPKRKTKITAAAAPSPSTSKAKKLLSTSKLEPPASSASSSGEEDEEQVASKHHAAAASPPPASKAKKLLSISKPEPPSSSASLSEQEDEEQVASKHHVSTSRKGAPASPSKNGNARKATDAKKRTSSEDVKQEVEVKKSKKAPTIAAKVVKQEEKLQTPPTAENSVETKEAPKQTLKEPEKPPKVIEEFYRQRIYKGKVGKHKESFANLSSTKRREIGEQMKAAQKQYIVDFEHYLKSLPKDEIRKYIQKVNAQKQQSTEDSDDDDDGEEGSSSEEEEDDD